MFLVCSCYRLTQSQINPLLNNGPADIFGYSVLQRQQLAKVTGAQVTFHDHQLAAPVVIVERKFLISKKVSLQVYVTS